MASVLDLRLKQEQAALKGMNEEQTASLKTALLHAARDALAVRTQMRTAQRGSIPCPVDIDESSHQGLAELARCRSDLSFHLLADACCVMDRCALRWSRMPALARPA
jgi:hypothetical protein